MSFKIITDSSCDFTKAQYNQLGLTYAPLTLLYKGEQHDSFTEEAELKAFYNGIRAGEMPTTSAVNPEGWATVMERVLAAGEDVLALCFTSGLSTTYQSAVIAADELQEKYPDRKIRVIDTLCAALGQGLLVWPACQKRDQGMDLDAVANWVEENKLRLCHWVTVDDLDHLKRGGRVSATTAFVGGLLNIKPIIHVDNDGKLDTVAKVRGRKAAMEYLVKQLVETGATAENETITIAHGDCPEDAAALEELVRKNCPFVKNVITGYVGGVIGAHTGPGVLVVFFLGSTR